MKTRIIFISIALLTFIMGAKAQEVKGKVVDAATGKPIANASIYLAGSSRGTTSNNLGEFSLKTTEAKKLLVVSCVGYQADTLSDYHNKLLHIKLKPRTNELREVVISAEDGMSRERKLRIFFREFIGSNRKDCIITNTDDINLRYKESTGTLVGEATRPLIILNKKLGYKITYFLSAFSHSLVPAWDPAETSYKGNYVFEEDTLGLAPAEIKKILQARDKAYYGSRMHFIRSVCANDLKENKFWYDYANYNFAFDNIRANKERLLKDTSITTLVKDINHFLQFPCMIIRYKSGGESHLSFTNGPKYVKLPPNGYNESNLIWSGKMGGQRVGVLLPVDFEPLEEL